MPEQVPMPEQVKRFVEERLCGCSFIHSGQPLRDGLLLAKEFGFTRVDVAVGGGNSHYDTVTVAEQPARFADEVRRETAALHLEVSECFALNFGAPINSPDTSMQQRTRELFRGLCDFAARADFRSVMLIAGPQHAEQSREYSRDLAARALADLVEIAGGKELHLNLEADCDSCVSTPDEVRELCERVPNLGLTLDHSHFISQGIAPERIEILYPFARHVHVRQSAPNQIVTGVNEGVVDFQDVLQKLDACGYNGLFCIEYLSLTPDETARYEAETRTIEMRNQLMGYGA